MSLARENLLASFAEPNESSFIRAREILSAVQSVRSMGHRPVGIARPQRSVLEALEDHLEGRRIQVGEDLLRHLVSGLQHEDSVMFLGTPRLSWHECWAQWAGDPQVTARQPGLGENFEQIGSRLLEQLRAMGLHWDRVSLWRARLELVLGEQDKATARWAGMLGSRSAFGGQIRLEQAAALLERGQPTACLRILRRASGVPGSMRLAAWANALMGGVPANPDSLQSDPWPVPAFLVALRERDPSLLQPLAGPIRVKGELVVQAVRLVRSAADIGALVLSVHSLCNGLSALEFSQVDPAVQPGLAGWGASRRSTWRSAGDPARDAMASCSTVFDHRTSSKPSAALHPDARSICITPIVAEDGSACGWLHAEWAQAPSVCAARMERIAAPWAEHMSLPVLGANGPGSIRNETRGGSECPTLDDPLIHRPFHRLMESTGFGLGRRRWYGFICEGGEPQLVASGGKALVMESDWQGGRGILGRAQRLGGVAAFNRKDPNLAIHLDAVEGLALPLKRGDLLIGYFCLEGVRSKDLVPRLTEALEQNAPEAARALEAVSFRRLHRERFRRPILLPTEAVGFAALLDRVSRASSSKDPVLLVGPPGVGKATLSRWCFHLRDLGVAKRLDARVFCRPQAGQGPVLLTEPELLSREGQALLLELIRAGRGRELILSTTSDPTRWKWNSDLLDLVLRCRVDVAPLDQRRGELSAWIEGLLDLHAQEEAVEAPQLTADALAGLWRQAWKGGLRQLSEAMATLVIQANGLSLDLEETQDLLAPMGVVLDRRLGVGPRSYPALAAACEETRTSSGRINLTAIARLMGWDKGTVPGQLKRAGLQ